MNFINETLHPKAEGLFTCIREAHADYHQHSEGGAFYVPLETWRKIEGYHDEKAADLYARIEEGFAGCLHMMPDVATSKLSLYLWQNDRVYPQ